MKVAINDKIILYKTGVFFTIKFTLFYSNSITNYLFLQWKVLLPEKLFQMEYSKIS